VIVRPRPSKFLIEKGEPIVFACSMKSSHDHRFGCVLRNGKIRIVGVTLTVQQGESQAEAQPYNVNWSCTFDTAKVLRYFHIAGSIGAYDGVSVEIASASARKPTVTEVALKKPVFSEDCCQISDSMIGVVSVERGFRLREFAIVPDTIVCITRSKKFNVTAIACSDGKLRIRSNQTGAKVATVSLDNEIGERILITRSWGFIVVKTERSIFVFTVNGVLKHRIADPGEWRDWFTFRTRDGVDYVVINEADGRVKWFEAGDPANVIEVSDWQFGVVAWSYCWKHDCFFIVLESGELLFKPRPIPAR